MFFPLRGDMHGSMRDGDRSAVLDKTETASDLELICCPVIERSFHMRWWKSLTTIPRCSARMLLLWDLTVCKSFCLLRYDARAYTWNFQLCVTYVFLTPPADTNCRVQQLSGIVIIIVHSPMGFFSYKQTWRLLYWAQSDPMALSWHVQTKLNLREHAVQY